MSENVGTREPLPITPSKIIYAPDTTRGMIEGAINKVKNSYNRYFRGADPVVKTKQEEEASVK